MPPGTVRLRFENLEGIVLVPATLHSTDHGDTSGPLALDTGAGFLALDFSLARHLGLTDPLAADTASLAYAQRPLQRLELGTLEMDQVSPVLTLDATIVRRVTDRPVLGLLGQHVLQSYTLVVDYREQSIALIPEEASASNDLPPDPMSRRAVSVPFRLAGDGKMLIEARVPGMMRRAQRTKRRVPVSDRDVPEMKQPEVAGIPATLTLIVDTGASKCVLFEESIVEWVPQAGRWPSLRGLSAPTLVGASEARLVRLPWLELARSSRRLRLLGPDVVAMKSELSGALSRGVGERVDGLLGYSFLKNYRFAIDYEHRVLWLDPLPRGWDGRRYEYSHVGVQLERDGPAARVVAVAEGSPASAAGIEAGDEVIAIDGIASTRFDITTLSRRLEGPPGTRVNLRIRRGTVDRDYSLKRRRLL